MRNALFIIGLVGLGLAGFAGQSYACQGDEVLFEDTFDTFDTTWGTPSESVKVDNGRLMMIPDPNEYVSVHNTAGVYDDIDFCVTATALSGDKLENAAYGVMFWYIDSNNYYAVEIDTNGKAAIYRSQRDNWLPQVRWQDTESVKKGAGEANQIRVVTLGNKATVYINGEEFKSIKGVPPKNGQQIGLIAESAKEASDTFTFDDLKVTLPKGSTSDDSQN